MKRIDFIFSPWFGLKLEKGTEIAFVFLIDDFKEDQPLKWKKINEIFYDEQRGNIRLWIDEDPEIGHVRSYSMGTIRLFGLVPRNFFEKTGGRQACVDRIKSTFFDGETPHILSEEILSEELD